MDSFKNNDPFKQLVKSKLADYKQEVPHSGWEKLESSLFAAQKTKVVHTKWLVSSFAAVAAALIGVFFVFQNMNNELPIHTAEYKTAPLAVPTNKDEKTLITKQNASKVKKSTPALFADNASSLQKNPAAAPSATSRDNDAPLDVSVDTPISQKKGDIASTTSINEQSKGKDKSSDIDEEIKQQMIEDFINEGKRYFDEVDDTKTTKRKNKHAISLTGRSGLLSSQQTNTLPTTLRSSVSDTYGDFTLSKMQAYNEEKEIKPESEINHNQPISFGLLTSFDITRKLQIETGLIYTYLSSETKNRSDDFNNTEKVQFHYLGIPLNVNYTILSVNKLNLFVTAGAMIEKDLNGKIKYSDNKIIPSLINSEYANETSSKISQKNPQLSLTGGVGITYPIYNKTNLFGKVGGRYYIKANNEFKTYYSDEKFGLDIQLGIKFNF